MTQEIAVLPVTSAEYVRTGFGRLSSYAVPFGGYIAMRSGSRQLLSAFPVSRSDTHGNV